MGELGAEILRTIARGVFFEIAIERIFNARVFKSGFARLFINERMKCGIGGVVRDEAQRISEEIWRNGKRFTDVKGGKTALTV